MKRGVMFNCKHGFDQVGTPFSECPDCQDRTRLAIDAWLARKEAENRVKNGRPPF